MPRRRRHDVVAFGLAALAVGAAACQADAGDAGCQLTRQVTLAGTPLTLLQDARLDQVGQGYYLLGSDGANVRWAAVSSEGTLSGEEAQPLPPGVTSAYYAVAGVETPGDTVLVGYLGTDAAGANGGLAVIAFPADGSPPAAPATTVVNFPGGVPAASSVVMISSRAGMNAGLAWIDSGSGQVMFATVDGTGAKTGAPVATSTSSGPPFSCLAFSAGKDDLTVLYYAQTTTIPGPGWIIAEANEGGAVDSTTELGLPMGTGCAVVSPTATGYGVSWQDTEGDWLAEYMPQKAPNPLSLSYPFASAADFGGSNLQPPIAGLAPFGTDFGVLLARPLDVELWRIEDTGSRRAGALIFPSIAGNFGTVSALAPSPFMAEGPLVATYADYTSPVGASQPTGGRLFLNAVCY
ncbi:MAG TPA: hypothetical protein VLC06_19765 [Polyangia bacterium]|jgi:hypothetical protein|nr:hypothetical protein [Polyangia bacterium]